MENRIAKKMYLYYNELLSESDCKDLAEDITKATKEEKYNKLINEWLNDGENYTDISIKGFSLVEVAKKLDDVHPNIPIAVLLGYLAETNSIEFQVLLSIASNKCIADYKLIENGLACEKAILNDGNWFLFSNNTTSDDLIECQMWQVLILNPLLAPQLSYEHNNNTAICLQDDGSYLIVPNADSL